MTYILGISAYYHDSAAALIADGQVVSAAQEERFTRKKHDASFPRHAVEYCLSEANISLAEVDHLVFYDKPLVKFERLLETYLSYAPRGFRSFLMAMPIWLKEKLFLKRTLRQEFAALSDIPEKQINNLLFAEHHQSHAASAFYPSPFERAAVLCLDGVGEWATTSVWMGEEEKLRPVWEIRFPHSLGLLYSAFTYYAGFKVNSGEYKLMGLAPYGEPTYVNEIKNHLMEIKPDGTFRLDMSYFNYASGLTMTSKKFHKLFGGAPRKPESEVSQKEMDLARSIQVVTEELVLQLANTIHKELEVDYLCLAGGVALNCVANGRLQREGPFKDIWIQPAAGDAGGALGCALAAWHDYLGKVRQVDAKDSMRGAYLGKSFSPEEIQTYLDKVGAPYVRLDDAEFFPEVTRVLTSDGVVGWFNGKMEFGPRALGGRSIIGDPRSVKMQSLMNLKIKYRESFRPFAPAVLEEKASEWFELETSSPYMLLVASINESKRLAVSAADEALFGIDKLNVPRSEIPAVTHVDYSARVQTVSRETNPRFHRLIEEFDSQTGCPVLVNTSFNVRGEPIVSSPEDAYRCFMRTEMDCLVLGSYILYKKDQPALADDQSWQQEFELD